MSSLRSMLYLIAKLLGDISALKNGTAGKRLARRLAGKATGRAMGKFFK